MHRRRKLKVPFVRIRHDRGRMEQIRRQRERFETIRYEKYTLYRRRLEFELEQFQKTFRLPPRVILYLKTRGMAPINFQFYSSSDFAAWLANGESSWEYGDETAQIMWKSRIVTIAAYLLPRKTREEWLGDLQESIHELISAGCPRWMRILITAGRIGLLCYALAWIRLRDLISSPGKSHE